ncbi:MAG: hypothetical protein ACYDCL_14330 [Myxococcales bacterium]
MGSTIAALCLALTVASPWSVEGHLASDTGWDSNVYRNFEGSPYDPTLPGGGAILGDGFLQVDGDLDVSGRPWEHQRTTLTAELGARFFANQGPEDEGVGQAELVHDIGLSRKLTLRLDASGKDKWVANDDRAFADYGAGVGLSLGPFWRTRLDIRGGYQAFDYFPDSDFSETGPSLSAIVTASPWRRQSIHAGYRLLPQFYQGPQNVLPSGATFGQRFDWYHVATAGYSLEAPFVLSVDYSFTDDRSDAYGESFLRHRVQILLGVALPWEIYLVATGALQITSYPDGLYLSPELLLLEDDDDLNDISIKVSRDLGKGFGLEVRYGYYRNDFQQNGLAYERQVAYLGVVYRH